MSSIRLSENQILPVNDFYTNVTTLGDNMLVCGYRDKKRYREIVKYEPYLFMNSNEPTNLQALKAGEKPQYVFRQSFETIRDARKFVDRYKDVENFEWYGMDRFVYPYIYDNYPGQVDYDTDLIKTHNIDIETANEHGGFPNVETANEAITLIGIGIKKKRLIFGYDDYTPKEKRVTFVRCKDEKDMLQKFLNFWSNDDYRPDIITGWNILGFDIPYIVNRITRVLGPIQANRLSPWNKLINKKTEMHGKENIIKVPLGVALLDYYQLYRKFTYTQLESYSLDHVAFVETGKRKLDYSEYESLYDLYKKNYEKFVDYNITDIDRVADIDDKNKFIDLVLAIAYDAKVNFADALTSVLLWDVIIHNYLMDHNIVVPKKKDSENVVIPGGYNKETIKGMHEWVVSFDLTSLYPHLIMQYNISPETFVRMTDKWSIENVDKLMETKPDIPDDLTMAANGAFFRKDRFGFLPALMKQQFNLRAKYKNEMLHHQRLLSDIKKELASRNSDK